MQSFAAVINLWPSCEDMARDLGIEGLNVRMWRRRDSIPGEWWGAVVEKADMRGYPVTLEVLAGIAGKQRPEPKRRTA